MVTDSLALTYWLSSLAYRTYPRAFLTKYFPSITAHAAVFCLHKNNWGYSKTTNWFTPHILLEQDLVNEKS